MDRSLTYHPHHLESLKMKVAIRVALIRKLAGTTQGPTLTRYRSAAANVIIDIGGDGVASAPKNLNRRRLGLFLISGGDVHISERWVFWNLPAAF